VVKKEQQRVSPSARDGKKRLLEPKDETRYKEPRISAE